MQNLTYQEVLKHTLQTHSTSMSVYTRKDGLKNQAHAAAALQCTKDYLQHLILAQNTCTGMVLRPLSAAMHQDLRVVPYLSQKHVHWRGFTAAVVLQCTKFAFRTSSPPITCAQATSVLTLRVWCMEPQCYNVLNFLFGPHLCQKHVHGLRMC